MMKTNLTYIILILSLFKGIDSQAQDKPNIIFILADDLGYGDTGPYGQKQIMTPSLDKMATEGMVFTDHYAGNTVCAPSRCTLMTGLDQGHAPIRGNKRDMDEGVIPLPLYSQTIAEMLKEKSDYVTAIFDKWHLGGIYSHSMPHDRGFDYYLGALSKFYKSNDPRYRPDLYRNDTLVIIKENNNGTRGVYDEDLITNDALNFIEVNKEKPFFIYLSYFLVHAPVQPAPGVEQYQNESWPQKEKDFAQTVTKLDSYVGMVMDKLKALNLDKNTLVIFSSDNGPHEEDGQDPEFFSSNGPLRGYKRDLYEGGIREPFIAWWPGKIKPGTTSSLISGFQDLMPTVAELADVAPPIGIDGISYLPTLLGKPQKKHDYLYWEFSERTPTQAIRMNDWKGIYFLDQHKFELYNLKNDIGEDNDIAKDHPEVVSALKRKMLDSHAYNEDFPLYKSEKYIQVNKKDPRYFQYSDGTTYIPIGLNICWPRFENDEEKAMKLMEERFGNLSENGGNYTRIWLSAPFYELEHARATGYDFIKAERIDRILALASKYGIKVKFCFENFRDLLNSPSRFPGSVPFDKPIYHVNDGGPLHSMEEYFGSQAGKSLFTQRMEFFCNRYGKNPNVFGWELWNEVNAVKANHDVVFDWTTEMLKKARTMFPNQLVMQSLGSFDNDAKIEPYQKYSRLENNDIAQVHRYLDPGAEYVVCKGPMDVLASDAVKTILSYTKGKPVLLTEVGAVEAHHSGPSKLYEIDKQGILLHDILFAPFFSGAAGPGQSWHWYFYVEKNNLWWQFGRFAEAIKGIDPVEEKFEPVYWETDQLRIYGLKGSKTFIAWCRDKNSNWHSELEEGKDPSIYHNIKIDLHEISGNISFYDPWQNSWSYAKSIKEIVLPDFKRSVVIKVEY